MSAPGVISKKLKFKGDKSKKKKRSHNHSHGETRDELEAMAAADPRGWMFPGNVNEINGPAYILLPTEPPTCLAYDSTRQRVYAAPIVIPQAPEGANDLTEAEILETIEPSDINHVWVVSRLSGSEDVISLRTSAGTFLTASPSGSLTASTPSRGPLEAFVPLLSTDSKFSAFSLQSQHNSKYLSATGKGGKVELRIDADIDGELEALRIKCQREFVFKARMGDDDGKNKKKSADEHSTSFEQELKKAQSHGYGEAKLNAGVMQDMKKAKKEGRYAEAMLNRRAAMKSDKFC
ncbi:uncharacterized protein L203_102672 [Cryptococcus depauperatus CBS 7841]|uniref:Protein FRG1 n=1 Tax=Cryptococcus depauperatus CBS 7841 TaxID=1295531 RepID=A0AAJ8M013_9TREE